MRLHTLQRNKQKLKYSLELGSFPRYRIVNGEQIETGESEIVYSTPLEMKSSLSMSGNEAEPTEYGLSFADYQAILLYPNDLYPLEEGSLIWAKSEVRNKLTTPVIVTLENGDKISTFYPQKNSADYIVIKISKSLNYTKAILQAINK